ncbi:MAG: HD domain-containing protein [Pseudomonadales bacterium]|nr:HD domain-containing protein [Pseudomonadales bacterium]
MQDPVGIDYEVSFQDLGNRQPYQSEITHQQVQEITPTKPGNEHPPQKAPQDIIDELPNSFLAVPDADFLLEMQQKLTTNSDFDKNDSAKVKQLPLSEFLNSRRWEKIVRSKGTFLSTLTRCLDPVEGEDTIKSIVQTFTYFGPESTVPAMLCAREPVLDAIKDEICKTKKFSVTEFDALYFEHFIFLDPKLAVDYLVGKQDDHNMNRHILKNLPGLLNEGQQLISFNHNWEPYVDVLSKHSDVSVSLYDNIIFSFANQEDFLERSEYYAQIIDDMFSNPLIAEELAKERSPYGHYTKLIIINPENLEKLNSRLRQANTSWLGKMRSRLDEQNLEEDIQKLIDRDEIFDSGTKRDSEELDRLLGDVYFTSLKHTGMSDAVRKFARAEKGEFFVRGNSFSAIESIIRNGAYAQECIPYIPPTPNFLPGFLNSIPVMDSLPSETIKFAQRNASLGEYMRQSGENGVIIIFSPKQETKQRSTHRTVKGFDSDDINKLTLIGMATDEIAGFIVNSDDQIEQLKKIMVDTEKFMHIFDKNGQPTFSIEEFTTLLNEKHTVLSVEEFLQENTILAELSQRKSGHGDDTLAEHTQRVMDNTGQIFTQANERMKKLLKLAALLHDDGKGLGMSQTEDNLAVASQYLSRIGGLSLYEKQLILSSIYNDEEIGVKILANFDDLRASQEDVKKTRESILELFSSQEELLFALDLYFADVSGIGKDQVMLTTWRVREKLTKLGFI